MASIGWSVGILVKILPTLGGHISYMRRSRAGGWGINPPLYFARGMVHTIIPPNVDAYVGISDKITSYLTI